MVQKNAPMRNELLKKIRTLSQLLMISGACNILMLAIVLYWYIKERPPTPLCEKRPTVFADTPVSQATTSNQRVIQSFNGKNLKQMIEEVNNETRLENGFTHQDLALGYLITELHFDINRAFVDIPTPNQKRRIIYKDIEGKPRELKTFADLKKGHFLAAASFASKEKWPLTPKGLFLLLKEQSDNPDKSLNYAFFLTQEFMSVELLFKRSKEEISRKQILDMILEGTWDSLSQFASYQRISQDLSDRQRRQFLLNYIMEGSPTAASLLLKTDAQYAVTNLNDEEVVSIINLSKERTRDAAKYALTMLASPRNDTVWQAAASLLYQYTEEPAPKGLTKSAALERFLPGLTTQPKQPPIKQTVIAKPQAPPQIKVPVKVVPPPQPAQRWKRGYTVKKGDTLWKVGHLFNVDVNELKQYNNIQNEELTPGTMLIVP